MANRTLPKGVREISLRPYPGRLYVATTKKAFSEAAKRIYGSSDIPSEEAGGTFRFDADRNGVAAYLIWAEGEEYWVHEIAHVVLHLFQRVGIHPVKAGGEPFCYMMQTLWQDIRGARKL